MGLRLFLVRIVYGIIVFFVICGCRSTSQNKLLASNVSQVSASFQVLDVSILFPRPQTSDDEARLLKLASSGANGPLISQDIFDKIPKLDGILPNSIQTFSITAIRVDPCFPSAATNVCRHQIRLVAQSIKSGVGASDTALHLFYDFDRNEFTSIIKDLRQLKVQSPTATENKPLGVHPGILEAGLNSDYFASWKSFILRYAGVAKLRRVAFAGVFEGGAGWPFGALKIQNGVGTLDPIPRLGSATKQVWGENPFLVPTERHGSITPKAVEGDSIDSIVTSENTARAPAENIRLAIGAAYRIENPNLHHPESVDCVSCHLADKVRRAAQKVRAIDSEFPDRFAGAPEMLDDDVRVSNTTNVRAFGWRGLKAAVIQRTLNESVVVAESINSWSVAPSR